MAGDKNKTSKTKSTQTNSYTPSTKTIKVIDPKTGKPYMYDKTYDAIFDTNGNQLDSDDFRHIREVMVTGKEIAYPRLVAQKKKELREKGITSEYAKYYKPGDSEKILKLLDHATGYYELTTDNDGDQEYRIAAAVEEVQDKLKNGNEIHAPNPTNVPLRWSLGLPMEGGFPGPITRGSWDISAYRPTRGGENVPYYFTPRGKDFGKDPTSSKIYKDIQDAAVSRMIGKALTIYSSNPSVASDGKVTSKFQNKSIQLEDEDMMIGDLGNYGVSIAPDSSYLSFHDRWKLSPNAANKIPTFAPDWVYKKALTDVGIPKELHKQAIAGFKAGKSGTEIVGGAVDVPVYDRIFEDPKTGKSIKELLKEYNNMAGSYAYGGKVKKRAYGGKLPIDMYGRSVRKYEGGGRTPINIAPIESLPAGYLQNPEYQEYLAKINSDGIEKVAQSPGILSTKSSNTTGDVVGAIGSIAGGFLSSAGTKQVDKGRIVGGTAMQAAGAVAPIATNPALLTATGGLSALAIPLAAGIGALAGIPKQKKYNRIEDADNIEEGMAMYQGLNQQNNYMQDPIRYAAYGGKINHYGDGGESYDPTTDPNLMKEVVITATRKNIVADMFAGIIENMNASGKAKNRKNNLEVMKTLTAYLQNPVQTSNFLNMSTGKAPAFYGDSNVAQFPGTYMPKAAYGGQQGELAQLEQLNGVKENYVDKYGRTKTTNATESHDAMASKGKTNTPTDYLQNGDNIFSAKSYSKNELTAILGAHEALTGENVKLGLDVLTPYYNTKSKTKISPADINKVVANKFNPKNLTNNSFNTAAINARNQTYANLATTKFNDALNPATFQGIAQQGNQQIEQILRAAYGGKMKKYAYGDGPYRMQSPVMIPDIVPPSAEAKWTEAQNLPVELAPPFDKAAWDNRPVNGVYEEWKGVPYTHPGSNTDPFADSGMGPQQEWKGIPYNYPGYNYTSPESLNGSATTGNGKSPYKLSSADMAALGVGGANAMASILTLQQKMYDNEVTDKSGVYNMKTELPDNFTNPTLGALRAGLQSSAQNNNWKNTSAMSSEMLSKTVTGLNSALLEQSRQNIGLFNAKQAAIYQALGVDTANKQAWNKDKTALGNYKLSAIGENLLKMASNGNTRAAENALAQMDDATLRAMLVTIGPNSKYFTEQIERIINSRKG